MKYMDVALRGSVSSTVIAIISLLPAPALAQQSSTAGAMPQTEVAAAQPASATPQTTAGQPQKVEGAQPSDASAIVVTGFRASLTAAVNLKRRSNEIIDAITSEDIS
jgi:iron complex outermembrane receptor protein